MNIKLMIATPAFDGRTHVQFAIALAETVSLLNKNHIFVDYKIVTSGSLLCAERNRLNQYFLDSDCTHMLCVDSDIGWNAQDVLKLLSMQEPFIAGVYPSRLERSFMFRPVLNEDKTIFFNPAKGLLKMEYIPVGFMILQKCVIEKMIEKFPETAFTSKDPSFKSGHALFNTEIKEGEFWGEDYVFCSRAREAGFEIWVDPTIYFDHAGNVGRLADVLNVVKTPDSIPEEAPNE